MAIHDISEADKNEENNVQTLASDMSQEKAALESQLQETLTKDRFFSALCSRLFFLLLLAVDLLWICYTVVKMSTLLVLFLCVFFKKELIELSLYKTWITLKRAFVCGLSLFVALLSPGFGVMIACTYFLMYDKEGIEEVIPSSLQEQFKDFLKGSPVQG